MGLPINDSMPRVPEPHSEISIEDEKLSSDLYIRTSWFDSALALDQIEKVGTTSENPRFAFKMVAFYGSEGCSSEETVTRSLRGDSPLVSMIYDASAGYSNVTRVIYDSLEISERESIAGDRNLN